VTHGGDVLRDLLLIAGVALGVVLLFQRLRLPALIAFIVTGVVIGPGGLGLVSDAELVRHLAEIGVVLLLFTVGLEFSIADLRALGRKPLIAGLLQIVLGVGIVAGVLLAFGLHPARAIFFGLLASLSSTAVVFKLLADRGEMFAPHGRVATGVALVQDVMVVPFVLLVPVLGGWMRGPLEPEAPTLQSLLTGLSLLAAVVLVFLAARRAIPWLLGRASRTGSREAFLFGVLLVVLGSAALAQWAGVSLALGAFIAGLMLAESDLKPQIAADILPFRDALASVFFVAIGMSLEPAALLAMPVAIVAATLGLVAVKLLSAFVAMRWAGIAARIAIAGALVLAQVGEFSFVLVQAGAPFGLLGAEGAQAFVSGAVFSLLLAPLLIARAPDWALAIDLARGGPAPDMKDARGATRNEAAHSELLQHHVVIAGFGLNGRNLARVLRSTRVPHVVVDLDPDGVLRATEDGSPAMLGDITHALIQGRAGVPRARVLVLALSDPRATREACRTARALARRVFIIARTRSVGDIDPLHALGANQVIPEEFETSIEIFSSVLRELRVPRNVIETQIQLLRHERYSLLRGIKLPPSVIEQLDLALQEGLTDTFLLLQHSPAIGRTLGELELLDAPGAQVVAVVRAGQALTELAPDFRLRVGDTLVLSGTHASMDRAFEKLEPPQAAPA
jgi:CPA2 family monovalent cation:H+ antiporter-2